VDYRKFLGAKTTEVLPYLGGPTVASETRRLRVRERVAMGWWAFEVEGRWARAMERAERTELGGLEGVRGPMVGGWLFVRGDEAVRVHLMPEEELEVLAPVGARKWHGGDWLFEETMFEGEVEGAMRERLMEDRAELDGIAEVTPALRAAYGYAVVLRRARAIGLGVSPLELVGRVHEVTTGETSVEGLLEEIEARRFMMEPGSTHRRAAGMGAALRAGRRGPAGEEDFEWRAAAVLEAAGATLLSTRVMQEGVSEVRFRYLGEQFVTIVEARTLHVYDAGICLSGEDEVLGLDSLPSVIHEAMRRGVLNITSW
jgi:hypothetical protein